MLKYKIIPDDVVKNLIEFLDEIQFEAASGNKPDDLHRINFINWMISELMNGIDGFDLPEDNDKDADIEIDMQDRWDTINNYKKEFGMEFPEDMSEEEWKKLIKQFDSFIDGWDKAYKKSNYKDKAKQNELKKFLQELKIDHELTPTEKLNYIMMNIEEEKKKVNLNHYDKLFVVQVLKNHIKNSYFN